MHWGLENGWCNFLEPAKWGVSVSLSDRPHWLGSNVIWGITLLLMWKPVRWRKFGVDRYEDDTDGERRDGWGQKKKRDGMIKCFLGIWVASDWDLCFFFDQDQSTRHPHNIFRIFGAMLKLPEVRQRARPRYDESVITLITTTWSERLHQQNQVGTFWDLV